MRPSITYTRGSDTQGPPQGGGSFGSGGPMPPSGYEPDKIIRAPEPPRSPDVDYEVDPEAEPENAYQVGQQARDFYEAHNDDGDGYQSQLQRPANFEGAYESQNAANFSDPEYLKSKQPLQRDTMSEARRIAARGRSNIRKLSKAADQGVAKFRNTFDDDSPENRERIKKLAEEKAKNIAKDQIGKRVGNQALREGLQTGLDKGAKKVAKEGLEKAGKAVAKKATEEAVKEGGKLAAKAAVRGGIEAGKEAIAAAGAASGAATFGLGLILSFLLNIAISLGLNDAIDAGFEFEKYLKSQDKEDFKKARFLAARGAAKVGMFILLLLWLCAMVSVGGIIITLPLTLYINAYMILGFIFKKNGMLQGLVWWEVAIVVLFDIFSFIIFAAFIGGIAWWICNQSPVAPGGAIAHVAASVYDWWTGSNYASTINEMCTSIMKF